MTVAGLAAAHKGMIPWFRSTLDTTVYAVLPFYYADSIAPLGEVERIGDALQRWTGLRVVDPLTLREELFGDQRPLDQATAVRVAERHGAGRFIRGEITRTGDSIRVFAGLYDTAAKGSLLHSANQRVAARKAAVDSALSRVTYNLLFRDSQAAVTSTVAGTHSLPAHQLYIQAQQFVSAEWNLPAAESAFTEALAFDRGYAQANLGIALTRSWQGRPVSGWQVQLSQALLKQGDLSERDRVVAHALQQQAFGEDATCSGWDELTRRYQNDYLIWYGIARCIAFDKSVLPDPQSPTGWTFRSSYGRALAAYERAFLLQPSLLTAFRYDSYESLQRLLFASGSDVRPGQNSEGMAFIAEPAWQADTLAFFPVLVDLTRTTSSFQRPGHNVAVQYLRRSFHRIAETWASSDNDDPNALFSLAISLALLGDPSALDTLSRARRIAADPTDALMMAGTEVFMRTAFFVSRQIASLNPVRDLADSLLKAHQPLSAPDPILLSGIAALTGRVYLAAEYARTPRFSARREVPGPLRPNAPALLIFAAFGGPRDSLRVLEERVRSGVLNGLPVADQRLAVHRWISRPAAEAFPDYLFRQFEDFAGMGDYLIDVQFALLQNELDSVTTTLRELGRRRGLRKYPRAPTMDRVFAEARIWAMVGDYATGADWIDLAFAELSQTSLQALAFPTRAAALVKAMALRAQIADKIDDSATAQLWRRAIGVLWTDADTVVSSDISLSTPAIESLPRHVGRQP
jgi:tetratricopeptide (TPR) repeat protein